MAAKNGRNKLVPLSLSSILSTTSSTLPPSSVFRGRVASVKPWSTHTRLASITLSPADESDTPDTRLKVEFKGWWADKASRRFRVGEVVVLRTVGAKVLVGSKKGKEKEGSEKKRRVRFEKELSGWVVRKGGEEEVVRYKATDPRPAPTAAAPRPAPAPRPPLPEKQPSPPAAPAIPSSSIASNAPAPRAPDRLLPPELTKTIPAKRAAPSPPPEEAAVPPPPAAKPAPVNPEGEGARSAKRRKQEEKLGWGCEANGTVYTAFDKVAERLVEPATGGNSRKFVNIIAQVHEVGEICPPRNPDGDFYRKFTLVCPSRSSPPVELQWYNKAEAAIPAVSSGDILVARGLAVKGSVFSSSFTAGSYDIAPYSILSTSHLLSPSGPSQHPDPAPPAPACPPGVNAWTWKKGLSKEVAYGVQLDEEELKYAARVAKFFRRGGSGVEATAAQEKGKGKEKEKEIAAAQSAPTVAATPSETKPGPRLSGGFGAGRPLLRIEEIEEGKFCDLIAMVIKFHNPTPTPIGSILTNHATELYLTDYTSHPSLFKYDASSSDHLLGVSLPGQLILRVSLFGYQSEPLRSALSSKFKSGGETGGVARGTLLHLRNLRIKEAASGILEGTMVEEMQEKYRYKRDVTVLSSGKPVMDERWREAMKGIQKRHREFWAAASTKPVKK